MKIFISSLYLINYKLFDYIILHVSLGSPAAFVEQDLAAAVHIDMKTINFGVFGNGAAPLLLTRQESHGQGRRWIPPMFV